LFFPKSLSWRGFLSLRLLTGNSVPAFFFCAAAGIAVDFGEFPGSELPARLLGLLRMDTEGFLSLFSHEACVTGWGELGFFCRLEPVPCVLEEVWRSTFFSQRNHFGGASVLDGLTWCLSVLPAYFSSGQTFFFLVGLEVPFCPFFDGECCGDVFFHPRTRTAFVLAP